MKHDYKFGEKGRVISENENHCAIQIKGQKGLVASKDDAAQLRDALAAWLFAGHVPDPTKEDQVAVMIGDSQDNQPPIVILAMGRKAWDYCADGKTHTFDLTAIGIPLRLMIAGGETREQVLADIQRGVAISGGTFEAPAGALDNNLGIKEPTKQ